MKLLWQAVLCTSLTIITLKARGVLLSLPIFCGREHFRDLNTIFWAQKTFSFDTPNVQNRVFMSKTF